MRKFRFASIYLQEHRIDSPCSMLITDAENALDHSHAHNLLTCKGIDAAEIWENVLNEFPQLRNIHFVELKNIEHPRRARALYEEHGWVIV